jgi:proteasome accessory factor A
MLKRALMGVETEYGVTALGRNRGLFDRQVLVDRFARAARDLYPHISDFGNGVFLQNGARFYIDSGMHPEWCTPECTDPLDAVAHVLAGEQTLATMSERLENQPGDIADLQIFRTNVDYGGTESSWGCHESYLHGMDPCAISNGIIPHLVSRIIFTGAGGFDPLAKGLEFSLSPRVAHLKQVISNQSTHDRGIFHTKNETLAKDGYNRLHIISGESLCSHLASYLKLGTTALVVAMIEARICQSAAVQLMDPLAAMQSFARDPRCKTTAALTGGQRKTAIEIQRHYLTHAEAHLNSKFMPEWAEAVCRSWRGVLDALEGAPESVETRLDWAMKHALYLSRTKRWGIAQEAIPKWSYIITRLRKALAATEYGDKPVAVDLVLSSSSPVRNEVSALTPYVRENGLDWDHLSRFTDMKRELFEIDMRFGQIGEKGIFDRLDSNGLVDHRVEGMRAAASAMTDPPSVGRARLRGDFVRRHSADQGHSFYGYWYGIWDYNARKVLDLSDPFETEERWREMTNAEVEWIRPSDTLNSASVNRRTRTR